MANITSILTDASSFFQSNTYKSFDDFYTEFVEKSMSYLPAEESRTDND